MQQISSSQCIEQCVFFGCSLLFWMHFWTSGDLAEQELKRIHGMNLKTLCWIVKVARQRTAVRLVFSAAHTSHLKVDVRDILWEFYIIWLFFHYTPHLTPGSCSLLFSWLKHPRTNRSRSRHRSGSICWPSLPTVFSNLWYWQLNIILTVALSHLRFSFRRQGWNNNCLWNSFSPENMSSFESRSETTHLFPFDPVKDPVAICWAVCVLCLCLAQKVVRLG